MMFRSSFYHTCLPRDHGHFKTGIQVLFTETRYGRDQADIEFELQYLLPVVGFQVRPFRSPTVTKLLIPERRAPGSKMSMLRFLLANYQTTLKNVLHCLLTCTLYCIV